MTKKILVTKNNPLHYAVVREVMMDLREYLFRKRMSVTEFAKKINYTRTYVNNILTGTKKAGKKLAKLIEKETNGEVKAEELLKNKENENG